MARSPAANIGRALLLIGSAAFAATIAAVFSGQHRLASLMFLLLAALAMLAVSFVCTRRHHPLVLRMAALMTGTEVVRVMDFCHEERLCLARDIGQGRYEAWWNWMHHSGHLVLMENGVVHPRCDACFCYAWRPLDKGLETLMMLRSDRWISWDQWRSMDHLEMLTVRRELVGDAA